MGKLFISEFIGAVAQLALFSLIPFIWWLVSARKRISLSGLG